MSVNQRAAALERELDRARDVLATKLNSFAVQLQDTIQIVSTARQAASFSFLGRELVNYAPAKCQGMRLKYDAFVDFQACGSTLQGYPDHLAA